MEADESWAFSKKLQTGNCIPFLVVEVAWCQSFQSLTAKMARWLKLGVLFVIGAFRNLESGDTVIIMKQKDSEEITFEKVVKFDEDEDFWIPLSKELIFANYEVQTYDARPGDKLIQLPVHIYFDDE